MEKTLAKFQAQYTLNIIIVHQSSSSTVLLIHIYNILYSQPLTHPPTLLAQTELNTVKSQSSKAHCYMFEQSGEEG